jgi:DNA (cytosine-5)-methyltransferase 1
MNKDLTLSSLFDGSGGFPLGGLLSGITPLWASEVEPFPIETWAEIWETHRQVMGGNTKPKTRNQIIKWLKAPHADAAEYKMWGNGVALPCVFFVLSGIAWVLNGNEE